MKNYYEFVLTTKKGKRAQTSYYDNLCDVIYNYRENPKAKEIWVRNIFLKEVYRLTAERLYAIVNELYKDEIEMLVDGNKMSILEGYIILSEKQIQNLNKLDYIIENSPQNYIDNFSSDMLHEWNVLSWAIGWARKNGVSRQCLCA